MSPKRSRSAEPLPPAVVELVHSLRRHLQGGGFRPGERYLSVRQAARRFGVSPVTAHRALANLAEQGLLVLRPGSGAYVAKPLAPRRPHRVVQVLLRDESALRERFLLDGLQLGLLETLPAQVVVQLHFLPRADPLAYLQELGDGDALGDGVVLLRVGRAVRQFFNQRRRVAVVIGTSEEDLALASVGHDQAELGRQAADLLRRERRRQAVLAMHDQWDLGDNQLVDALHQAQRQTSPRVDLRVQSVPSEPDLARQVLRRMLASLGGQSALLCRSGQLALQAAAVAREVGLAVPQRALLVALGSDGLARQRPALPLIAPPNDDRAIGQVAARLLLSQWEDGRRPTARLNLPQPLSPL